MSFFYKRIKTAYGRCLPMLYAVLALYLIFLLLRYPALSSEYAFTGLTLWFTKMIPVLLPFMILSGIMIRMNMTERFISLLHPLIHALFRTSKNGSYAILMGFLCGFPMGARVVGELREANRLSSLESTRLLAFCNNIGPIYFFSYVVPTLGIEKPFIPFLIMYGVPLLYGLFLLRMPVFGRQSDLSIAEQTPSRDAHVLSQRVSSEKGMPLLAAVDGAILSGLSGIAGLGGYMVFFNLLNVLFVPFSRMPSFLAPLYNCILEITSGIDRAGQSMPYLVLILLPFGGFSCICQTYSMIRGTDLHIRPYVFHKLVQTAITALCYLLWRPF